MSWQLVCLNMRNTFATSPYLAPQHGRQRFSKNPTSTCLEHSLLSKLRLKAK